MFHELNSGKSCERIESDGPEMIFRHDPIDPLRYQIGDGVSVRSADGFVFIGRVSDVDNHGMDECQASPHIHVTLS